MVKGQRGVVSPIVVLLGVFVVLFVAAAAFGYWAYQGRQDYKNNDQKKIDAAVAKATADQAVVLKQQFDQQSKSPVKTYQGDAEFGSVIFDYPKTWNAYVPPGDSGSPINSYYFPDVIPGTGGGVSFALRAQLSNDSYDGVVSGFEGKVRGGQVKSVPYVPDKLKNIPGVQLGVRLDGNIIADKQGAMVIMKVRDRTLKLWTESTDFLSDFNNVVLPSLTFKP